MKPTIKYQPSSEERKQWWLFCYAITSMDKAIECCRLVKLHCFDNRHELYEPLIVAAHSNYARPFGPNHGAGKLNEETVPSALIPIHRWIIDFRNKVLSHTSALHHEQANRPMHDVVCKRSGQNHEYSTSCPMPTIESYEDFANHCCIMRKMFRAKILEFEKKYSHLMPSQDGDFLLSLDESLDLFIPHILPTSSIISYS